MAVLGDGLKALFSRISSIMVVHSGSSDHYTGTTAFLQEREGVVNALKQCVYIYIFKKKNLKMSRSEDYSKRP